MKTLRLFVLSLALVSVLFHSKPSQAAVGAIAGVPAIVTGGIVIAGGAAGLQVVFTTIDLLTSPSDVKGASLWLLFLSVPLTLLGLVILEDDQSANFSPLTQEAARKLQISPKELKAYNDEIDELNSLAQFVDSNITREGKEGLQESAALWGDIKDAVSPEAFSALVKVMSPAFKR